MITYWNRLKKIEETAFKYQTLKLRKMIEKPLKEAVSINK